MDRNQFQEWLSGVDGLSQAQSQQVQGVLSGEAEEIASLEAIEARCQSAFNCDPLSASNFDPSCGTERQLRRSRSWTSSRRRSIPSFLCKLFLAAFPSLHRN